MTQYMLSVHDNPDAVFGDEDVQRLYKQVDAFNAEVQAAGKWVFGGGLEPAGSATVVDGRGAEPAITDGPYIETKEYLGGFWIIEAADLDEALDWARRGSAACEGKVEVRPFQAE